MYVRARPRDRERARERARKSVWATLCASSVRMLPQPLASPLPGQRAACAIFMSPEVACNRFYFVIVLVALPFVFFMCRLLPSFLSPARSGSLFYFFSSLLLLLLLLPLRTFGANRWPHKSNMSQQFRCQNFFSSFSFLFFCIFTTSEDGPKSKGAKPKGQ